MPTRNDLDPSLVGGASIFGVGWGLVGLCPGPALANLSRSSVEILVFVAAMLVGTMATRIALRPRPNPALTNPS